MTDRRSKVSVIGVAVAVAAIWILPPLGFVLAICAVVALLPWGSTLGERFLGTCITALGSMALISTRLLPFTFHQTSVRLVLTAAVLAALGVSFLPRYRTYPIPRPQSSDWLLLAAWGLSAGWLLFAYLGRSTEETLAGLFLTGWDNHGHFTTFANIYEVGSMTWPTADGSVAWNQLYPTLHTGVWAFGQLAIQTGGMDTRAELLTPFVMWSGVSAALAFAAMSWVAGDIAARLVVRGTTPSILRTWARTLGVLGTTAFFLLSSSSRLFNYGFTNFIMGVAVIVVASYLAVTSFQRADRLGAPLVLLAGLATIGMWTPLIIGLVPAGIVVVVSLWRRWPSVAIAWSLATAGLLGGVTLWWSRQMITASGSSSTGDYSANLGGITGGSVPFNLALAMASPIVVACIGYVIAQRRGWSLATAISGPTLATALLLLPMASAADLAQTSRLQSYYVLKVLNAVLLMGVPLIIASVAVGMVLTLAATGVLRRSVQAVLLLVAAGMTGIAAFGFIGTSNAMLAPGFGTAPGVVGAIDRVNAVNDPLAGEAILRATKASLPYQQEYMTMLWDGAGMLPNLWVQSLAGVLSQDRQQFIAGIPPFPYGEETVDYVKNQMDEDPSLRMAMLWFRDPTRVLLEPLLKTKGDYFVELVNVPMRSSNLCPECTL